MLIPTTLLLSLSLPLLTTALPLDAPTNTTEPLFTNFPSTLEERGHYGWLSSYAPTDRTCKGGWGGSRPKIMGDCIPFTPVSDNVGINWGTAPYKIAGLDAFSDDKCGHQVGVTIEAPKKGRSCVSVMGESKGKGWKSVRYHESV
ncbi:hypothetical protein G7Y79_00049g084790 [Physcia stellaris]|nr:hypothetical protein G7Y79_00049g084790 [Physcia stellaris]